MAQGKKSFVAYSDWKSTFDELPDDIAGKLIKHIFAYVNDEEPVSDNFIINAVFANIKNTLKRDLNKWDNQLNQRREAGKRSAELRATKSNDRSISFNEKVRNSTVSDSVSVNDSVSDSVILLEKETKKKIFRFKSALIDFGFENGLVEDWLTIRKNKKASNTETAFKSIESEFLKCENELNVDRNTALKYAVESSWSGFKSQWIKNEQIKNQNNGKQTNGRISDAERLDSIINGGKYDHLI